MMEIKPNNLKAVLKVRGLTQKAIAMMTGINQTDISSVACGSKPAGPGWRKRIAKALKMPESEIFPE